MITKNIMFFDDISIKILINLFSQIAGHFIQNDLTFFRVIFFFLLDKIEILTNLRKT